MPPNPMKKFRGFFNKNTTFLKRTRSLNIGEPYDFKHLMHVGMDLQHMVVNNGDYEQFLNSTKIDKKNANSNQKKKNLMRSAENLNFKFYNSNPEISSPLDFSHLVHVKYDAITGKYVGLPVEWEEKVNGTNGTPSNKKIRF